MLNTIHLANKLEKLKKLSLAKVALKLHYNDQLKWKKLKNTYDRCWKVAPARPSSDALRQALRC